MPRHALLLLPLLLPLSCNDTAEGDDLPIGGFTSGPLATDTLTGDMTSDSNTSSTVPATDGSNLSHDTHIQPIWDANCITVGCHAAEGPQAGLDLATAGARSRMCEVPFSMGSMPLVDCANADSFNSYVLRKIQGTHLDGDIEGAAGGSMPPAGIDPLTAAEQETIESWIDGGANP
ncbi:MAG: hypothetical protein K0V04_31515 [Deltaproteobacteria bacterium]|nr:hypothetical protein [Deltaproteobacteria bacterium]